MCLSTGLYADKALKVARRELAWECDYIREAKCCERFRCESVVCFHTSLNCFEKPLLFYFTALTRSSQALEFLIVIVYFINILSDFNEVLSLKLVTHEMY